MKARFATVAAAMAALAWLPAAPTYAQPAAAPAAPAAAPAAPAAAPAAPAAAPAVAAAASPVQVQARFEPAEPGFGDRVELVVTLRYPQDVRAFFPGRPSLKPLLALPAEPGKTERRREGDVTVETLRVPAVVARAGLLRTSRIEIPWHRVDASGGAGESGTAEVPPLTLTVRSGLGDEAAPAPAPLPAPLPLVEDNTPLRMGLLLLAMAAVGGLLTWLGLRLLRDRLRQREPEPVIPPHITALERLDLLLSSGRLEAEEPRLVYGELSEILRAYVGARYRFAALDMTSTELLQSLQGRDLGGITAAEVEDFTSEGDLVKFARLPLAADALRGRLIWVRRLVERTMQSAEELERLRAQQLARLARQQRLRIAVMAPRELRLRAFAWDAVVGAAATALVAWLAIDTAQQGLFDAAYALVLVWMALRDLLGEGSPGKAWTGLRVVQWLDAAEVDPDAVLHDERAAREAGRQAMAATAGQRILRNALLALPGAGLIAEAVTLFRLPELRRLGDVWAGTRVIDGRYGLRRGLPGLAGTVALGLLAAALLAAPLWLGGRPL